MLRAVCDCVLNTIKTKEMVVFFWRPRPHLLLASIEAVDVELVRTPEYLGLQLDDRLDWSAKRWHSLQEGAEAVLFPYRRLGSFNICRKLLLMFYQLVVASVLLSAVVCRGGGTQKRDAMRLDRLVRRAGSMVGTELDALMSLAERRTLNKLLSVMDHARNGQ